ncbi:MAG: hypothetical protein Q9222_002107 [Ikaeria aurantiellina]
MGHIMADTVKANIVVDRTPSDTTEDTCWHIPNATTIATNSVTAHDISTDTSKDIGKDISKDIGKDISNDTSNNTSNHAIKAHAEP